MLLLFILFLHCGEERERNISTLCMFSTYGRTNKVDFDLHCVLVTILSGAALIIKDDSYSHSVS